MSITIVRVYKIWNYSVLVESKTRYNKLQKKKIKHKYVLKYYGLCSLYICIYKNDEQMFGLKCFLKDLSGRPLSYVIIAKLFDCTIY